MRRTLDPTALGFGPMDEDIFAWPPERRATIKALPCTLPEALDALEADQTFLLAGGVFTEDILERWVARRRDEIREVRSRPHPYEIELYYDL
jgi:glutamine synthetase